MGSHVVGQGQSSAAHVSWQCAGWEAGTDGLWGTPYLVDIGYHISGRVPHCTELGGQGLPLLREHTHVRGVHQYWHHAQALLLQRVEHHQEPVGGNTGMASQPHSIPDVPCSTLPTDLLPLPTASQVSPQSRKSPEQGRRPYRGEVPSLTTVLSGRESWLERVSSWGGVIKSWGVPDAPASWAQGHGHNLGPSSWPLQYGVAPRGMGTVCQTAGSQGLVLLTMPRSGAAGSWR